MNWEVALKTSLNNDWDSFLKEEISKEYFQKIINFLEENDSKIIYPEKENVFSAFKFCQKNDIKIVILGQDPYHGKGQAHGLSFSVLDGVKIPPSLKNMYKELEDNLGIKRNNGNLVDWSNQGVFLLNNTLTVFESNANSHKDIGWNTFTDNVIKHLDDTIKPIFVLWGGFAHKKEKLISNSKVIKNTHPSPLSAYRGFLGSKPFSTVNKMLREQNKKEIKW